MRFILILSLLLAACAPHRDMTKVTLGGGNFIQRNYDAADKVNTQLGQMKVQKDYPILVASIVNMNQFNQTSTFGRLIAEHVAARFAQLNYQVVEPKLREDLIIREDGEFLMTRELKQIAKSVSAQAVVVGTYVETQQDVFVNLKVVQPETNLVLGAFSYAVPKGKDIKEMLAN